jgi:hypothetical protein
MHTQQLEQPTSLPGPKAHAPWLKNGRSPSIALRGFGWIMAPWPETAATNAAASSIAGFPRSGSNYLMN